MKKLILCLIACLSIALMFTSCEKEESCDESLLIGEWKGIERILDEDHEMHYKYMGNHTGLMWDKSADMTEEDGQAFNWTLDKSDLTQIHLFELSGGTNVTKVYTVTELTSTSLKYEERLPNSVVKYSYTKVNNIR